MRLIFTFLVLAALNPPAWAGDPDRKMAGKSEEWLEKRFIKEKDTVLRAAVVREMGARQNPTFMDELLRAASDRAREVRREAILSLAAYGPDLQEPARDRAYLAALRDADPEVLRAARESLAARIQAGRALEPIIEELLATLSGASDWQGRAASAQLLERLPEQDSQERDQEVQRGLTKAARLDAHAEVRRASVIALGTRGVESATEMLSKLRNTDPNEQVRLAAEDALRRIGVPATSTVVAVLPFETRSSSREVREFTQGLQDYMTGAIAAARVATVVERRQISKVLGELRFQDTSIDDGRAMKVGKLLRASEVVTGTIQIEGDELVCIVKRIDVATGKVEAPQPAHGGLMDLASLQRHCSKRLLGTY